LRRIATYFSAIVAVGCLQIFPAEAVQFLAEERVTSDTRNCEMTRNPNHSMAVGRDGTVHLVFWSGDGSLQTSPAHPTTVWYCRRDPSGRWARPEIVDDSYTSQGARVGGRHPALLLRPNGEVRLFWHDYRNCSAAHNWIENVELYEDVRPSTGSFSPNDLRLTNTLAVHDGDNGYVPQAVAAPTGEIFVAWYDYHFNPNLADLFLMRSNAQGIFNLAAPLDTWRVTDVSQRGNTLSYTLPDVALDASNTAHLVWTRDNANGYSVYFGKKYTDGRPMQTTVLSTTGGDFFDPSHITSSPGGDFYAVWTEHGTLGGNSSLVVQRLRPTRATFDPPLQIVATASNQKHADVKVDSLGYLHLAWVDDRNGHDEIFYGLYDPENKILLSETKVSGGPSVSARPCIVVGENQAVSIAWMDYRSGVGQIYFRTTQRPAEARSQWPLYR